MNDKPKLWTKDFLIVSSVNFFFFNFLCLDGDINHLYDG